MTAKSYPIPVLLRVVSAIALLLFALFAALHAIGGNSVMAWVAFVLFLSLGVGFAFGKVPAPSMVEKSRYKINLATFLVVIGVVAWLIARKLGA